MDNPCYFDFSYEPSTITGCDPNHCSEKGGWLVCDFGKKYQDWADRTKLAKAREIGIIAAGILGVTPNHRQKFRLTHYIKKHL